MQFRLHSYGYAPYIAPCIALNLNTRTFKELIVRYLGIWVGDAIVELQGSGLIRIVSPQRFLKDRSGGTIYVACINKLPIENRGLVEAAINQVYQFRNYDLLKNNCYRFCFACLAGHEEYIETFTEFNHRISDFYKAEVEWREANVSRLSS